MKRILVFLFSLMQLMNISAQKPADFKTLIVNKKIKEFPDRFDLNSPLNAFVTYKYVHINGKNRLLRSVHSAKLKPLFPDSVAADSLVPEDLRNRFLETTINEVTVYKDSVAFVISEEQNYYSIRSFYLEEGNWLSTGENTSLTIEGAREKVLERAELFFLDFLSVQKEFYGGIQ